MATSNFASSKLYIDRNIVASNYKKLQNMLQPNVIATANIKANAYGLGAVPMMKCLSSAGCNGFFVTSIDEALQLRNHSLTDEIYVLNGIYAGEEEAFTQNYIMPSLNTKEQFTLFNNYCIKKGKAFKAILNIDTGINQLGFSAEDALSLAKAGFFNQKAKIHFIMSQLASEREKIDINSKNNQFSLIMQIKQIFNIPISFATSHNFLSNPDYQCDIVRFGIMLYGCSTPQELNLDLESAILLTSPIIQITEAKEDMFIGYDNSRKVNKGSILATIPIGYADGLFRTISNKGLCYISEYEAPILGQISMDLIVLDVSKIPNYKLYLGAEVEILGKNMSIKQMATYANTTCHDVLISLSNRIQRVYI
jgi:alanine racemase